MFQVVISTLPMSSLYNSPSRWEGMGERHLIPLASLEALYPIPPNVVN